MKTLLSIILTYCIRPFYGSGLGMVFPLKQLNQFYVRISQGREEIIETTSGFKMAVQYGKYIDNTILSDWVWEPNITDLIKNTLHKWDIFIDAGANIGYDTLLAASCVGETGSVLSFEPASANYARLVKNVELNSFHNVQTFQVWLWNTNFETNLYLDNINPGAASVLSSRSSDEWIEISTIKVKIFDEMFPMQKCSLLKMDIEWYELEALKWMKNLLEINDLKIILEYSPGLYEKMDSAGNTGKEILEFIESFWYKIHHIHTDGSYSAIGSIPEYYKKIQTQWWQSDIYCLR